MHQQRLADWLVALFVVAARSVLVDYEWIGVDAAAKDVNYYCRGVICPLSELQLF